ncbi:SETMR methyltransferase, partial [Acromyrmex insinuator]
QTINGDYYAALLDHFNNILKKKRFHLAKKKVFFYQDNARVHTCPAPIAKFNEFHYELLPHPADSPDLAPCDYFLFLNLKKWRKEIHHQRAAHHRNRGLFQRVGQIILFGWLEKVVESLDQVYRTERKLC